MFQFCLAVVSLLLPNPSWNVRPVHYETMKSTLSLWRQEYEVLSSEYNSTFEMIGWHATQKSKGCFGLYHNEEPRALSQVYQSGADTLLRSVITPIDEDAAGTVLMYRIHQEFDIKFDWDALKKIRRWYVAASFITNDTFRLN